MNWLTNLFWDIRFKIEDAIYDWKNKADATEWDRESLMDFESEEEVEVKPKKKKKSVKKAKKSI
jgi:hypothetical protein